MKSIKTMKKHNITRYAEGFTLVELLIVISVIGILVAISYVGYSAIFGRADKSTTEYNLSNCVKSLSMSYIEEGSYPTTSEYESSLPSGCPKNGKINRTLYEYTGADGTSYRLTASIESLSYLAVRTSPQTSPTEGAHNVQLLIIGGGGGGGSSYGGGGGGGGFTHIQSYPLSVGSHSVVVGSGGATDSVGGNSSFDSLFSPGGGAGGKYLASNDLDGGSGGGSSGNSSLGNNQNGGGSSACLQSCRGFGGGQGGRNGGAGGGGAGGAGSNATGSVTCFLFLKCRDTGGAGGSGYASSITGDSQTFSPGGNGANSIGGGYQCYLTGGGGGAGTRGCTGIVIISYPSNWITINGGEGDTFYTDSNNLGQRITGPYDGGHTIKRFYTAGSHQLTVDYL